MQPPCGLRVATATWMLLPFFLPMAAWISTAPRCVLVLRGISLSMTCPYPPMFTKSLRVMCVWIPFQFDDGSTPLIAAAEHGHVAVVDALIAAGSKLNECKVGCAMHRVIVCLFDPCWLETTVSNAFLQHFLLLQSSHMSGHGSVVAELRLRLAKSVGGPVSFPHRCRMLMAKSSM